MKHFILLVLFFIFGLVVVISFQAKASVPNISAHVGIGIGYQLCPPTSGTPPLDTAFECSGLVGKPLAVDLELVNKPAAKPTWLYWEAPYTREIQFNDVTVKLEALVMYAKYDGLTTAFIDGRVTSVRGGVENAPVYFRVSAPDFTKFNYSSAFGNAVIFPIQGRPDLFTPYATISSVP